MRKSFKFRIYPTRAQIEILLSILNACRFLYNCALEQRRDVWTSRKQSLTAYTQIKQLSEVRREFPEFKAIYSQVFQDVIQRLDKAFKGFFLRLKHKGERAGFPRFKGIEFFNSFTYPQAYNSSVKVKEKKIWFSKIGAIKIRKHREIEGRIKTVTIKREGKRWYAVISCDNMPLKVLPPAEKEEVGIDLGLNRLATLSDGTTIDNPRWLRKSEEALKEAQRMLSVQKKGTLKRRRARQQLSKLHRKVGNQRRDFLHKKSRELVNRYGLICLEALCIKNLLRKRNGENHQDTGLHKSIGDVAWGMFVSFLLQKVEETAGTRRICQVNSQNTTRTCSRCGHILREGLSLSQREFFCPHCQLLIDRDLNASLNILRAGRLPVQAVA
jgi:putative transposase